MSLLGDFLPRPTIGVMGCLPELPDEFPLTMKENSGNVIHANAPFEMFDSVAFYKDSLFSSENLGNFIDYINSHASHLIVTFANTFRLGKEDGTKYERLMSFLKKVRIPIVPFGLGAQAPNVDLSLGLPPEASDLIKYLGDHCEQVGVRGDFTAEVLKHYGGITNVVVTGCPSFFSRPQAFSVLARNLQNRRDGSPSFNGTVYQNPAEKTMLVRAIVENHWLVEPVNQKTAQYSHDLRSGQTKISPPWFLKGPIKNGDVSADKVEDFFRNRMVLFRRPESWYEFNRQQVSFTYGTRFHANMASLLSGVPALWVTHDSRTEELARTLRLPAVSRAEATNLATDELAQLIDYTPLFDNLGELFERFNRYLDAHELPRIPVPSIT